MGDVIDIGQRGGEPTRVPAPPAPNPEKPGDRARTWGQAIDHLWFLFDSGDHGRLRQLLGEWAVAARNVPLPAEVFDMGADEQER